VGSHGRLCATLSLLLWKPALGVDLVLKPGHEAAARRGCDLAAVVAGSARKPADACHLTANEGIARGHDYAGAGGNRGAAEAGEIRRRRSASASVK